jgi:hypothetical protein
MKTSINICVLIMLLTVASLASANGTLSIQSATSNGSVGTSTIQANAGTVHLQVYYDPGNNPDLAGFKIWVDAGSEIITAASMPSYGDLNATLGCTPIDAVTINYPVYPLQIIQFDAANDTGCALSSGVWGTLDINYNGTGTLVINPQIQGLWDTNFERIDLGTTGLVGVTIEPLPEPATMLLLGLGGMMIRKFKSKS